MDITNVETVVILSILNASKPESREPPDDDLHHVAGYVICTNGVAGYRDYRGARRRERVSDQQIELVEEFLQACRKTRWARQHLSPLASDLKHWVEAWAGQYISTGAAIVGALQSGLPIAQYQKNGRNALIGVDLEQARTLAARLCHLPIKRPAPDPEFWRAYAREHGIEPEPEVEPELPPLTAPDPERAEFLDQIWDYFESIKED